jgi:hypothetical protein
MEKLRIHILCPASTCGEGMVKLDIKSASGSEEYSNYINKLAVRARADRIRTYAMFVCPSKPGMSAADCLTWEK